MSTTLTELFIPITETKPKRKARRANPVTVTTADGKVSTRKPSKAQFLADQFRNWATATTNLDEATLRLISVLVNDDSISARKASEIAVESLGNARGWGKDRISALRWTAPVWALLGSGIPADDQPTDDEGNLLTVTDILARVSTVANRLGKARVDEALASVDEPSVVAYLTALDDATTGTNSDPVVADEAGEDEAEADEPKAGKTDADRIKAVLNTLSGLEYDETLAGALPALIDAVSVIVAKATAPATV